MRALASCALVVAALSCKSHKSLLDDTGSSTGASSGTSEGSAATKSVDAPPMPAAVTSTRADPQIHELGMEHVVPSAIMIELATPIVDRGAVGQVCLLLVVLFSPVFVGSLL